MSLIGILLLTLSSWGVFSRHFASGIIGKNFLSLAAITAALNVVDPHNIAPACASGALLVIGVLYAAFRPTRKRPLFIDRRAKPRTT